MISSFVEVDSVKNRIDSAAGLIVFALVCAGLSGCASNEEYWETADFGDSVRQTIALQTDTAGSAGTGLDGAKAVNIYNAYRDDVAVRSDVGFAEREVVQDVEFNMGN